MKLGARSAGAEPVTLGTKGPGAKCGAISAILFASGSNVKFLPKRAKLKKIYIYVGVQFGI